MLNKLEQVEKSIRLEQAKLQPSDKTEYTLDDILSTRITHASNIQPIEPIIEISGRIFAARGDFSVIGGLPKAGKTSTAVPILATAFMKDVTGIDTLGIRTKYCDGKPVIYIDTEQSEPFTDRIRKRVCKMIGCDKEPDNLYIFNWRMFRYNQMRSMFNSLVKVLPEIHLILLDGGVDLIRDPNDTTEAFSAIEDLKTSGCTVVVYVHENPGSSNKLRGNYGSEAERKCLGTIVVKKDRQHQDVHIIECKLLRADRNFAPIPFTYDAGKGLHVTLDHTIAKEVLKTKEQVKAEKLKELAKRCLITGGKKSGDLVELIIQYTPDIEGKKCSERTARTRIKEMEDSGFISKKDDFFHLNDLNTDI